MEAAPHTAAHFLESGLAPPDPRILHVQRIRQRNISIVSVVSLSLFLLAYASELYDEYLERASRRAYYENLRFPAECDDLYLSSGTSSGPFGMLKKVLQQSSYARCEALRRERNDALYQSTFPRPLVCLTRVFTRCLYTPFQQMGDALGDFFHNVLKHLSAPEAAWLLVFVIVVLVARGLRQKDRFTPLNAFGAPRFAASAMFSQPSCSGVRTVDELESGVDADAVAWLK